MFHKDASSLGKNNRTIPLRKSDRRRLRQVAQEFLTKSTGSATATTATTTATATEDRNNTVLVAILDLAFLHGTLVARPIHHDILGKVTLYWRSPTTTSSSTTPSRHDGPQELEGEDVIKVVDEKGNVKIIQWPYRITTQCIWIHVDPPPGTTNSNNQHQQQDAPTVALLAVLSSFCPNSFQIPLVVIPSAVSKFLCRGAHLMRAGILQLSGDGGDSSMKVDNHNNTNYNNQDLSKVPTVMNNMPKTTSKPYHMHALKSGYNNNQTTKKLTPTTTYSIVMPPPPPPPIVAIQVLGNPQIMAVGQMTVGTTRSTIGAAQKGIAVQIWTCFGDDLWQQSQPPKNQRQHAQEMTSRSSNGTVNLVGGSVFDDGNYGNVGFLQGALVRPIQRVQDQAMSDNDDDENDDDDSSDQHTQHNDANNVNEIISNNHETNVNASNQLDSIATESKGCTTEIVEQHPQHLDPNGAHSLKNDEAKTTDNGIQENANIPTANENNHEIPIIDDAETTTLPSDTNPHDLVLHQAVCQALAKIQDKQLPMTTATFYAQYVIPNRPPDTTIQLGQTTYKKFSKYLVVQVEHDLLQVGSDPKTKDPVAFLTKINRRHEDLRGISRSTTTATTTNASIGNRKGQKLVLVDLFVIPHHWVKRMRLDEGQVKAANAKSEERRGTGLLSMPEARSILDDYLARESLVHVSRGDMIQLDGPLTDALFPKSKRRDDSSSNNDTAPPPQAMTRKDIAERWSSKLEKGFALVEMPGSRIRRLGRGKPPEVSMEVSMRQGKKYVTRLRGLEDFGVDATEFSKDVAKRFACAAAIDTAPVSGSLKKGQVELVFQGHLVEELQAFLLGDERLSSHGGVKGSPYCLPNNAIQVSLKKGVPAKKKR